MRPGLRCRGPDSLLRLSFGISAAQVESVVEPDRIGNDVRWESVAIVGIHWPILLKVAS